MNAPCTRDRGSILVGTMAFIAVSSLVGVAVAGLAVASYSDATLRKGRLEINLAADGAMRIALEQLRSPQTVVLGGTTAGSTLVTAAVNAFQPSDVGTIIVADSLDEGTVIATYVSPTRVTVSEPALSTLASTTLEFGDVECGVTPGRLITASIGGRQATVDCVREPTDTGQFGSPALVITGPDGLELKEEPNLVLGDIYFTDPASISLGKKITIDEGDVWYPAATCPGTPPLIDRLSFALPTVQQYSCVRTTAPDKLSDVLTAPALPPVPGAAAASRLVSGCRVFSPGRYTNANKPDLDGETSAYLTSGVYYFDNLGEIVVKNTIVSGGQPGMAPAADDGESLWNLPCNNAAADPTVMDTGAGVTIVLGGSSRITVEKDGGLELFAPDSGFSVVALPVATNGYQAVNPATASDPHLDQRKGGSMLRVHGQVWMPSGHLSVGPATPAAATVDGAIPLGGQLLGGVVVRRLEVAEKPPTGGFTAQAARSDVVHRVLLVATSGESSVRVVAEVRPTGDDLSVVSWQESRDPTISTPTARSLVTRPQLAEESDSGRRDYTLTNALDPLFTGDAPTGATVTVYVDGVASGVATAQSNRYFVRTIGISAGRHDVHITSQKPGGSPVTSLPTVVTIDRTAPPSAQAVAVAPLYNVRTSAHIGRTVAYYVYANAPVGSGVDSMVVDASAVSPGDSSVVMTAGTYTVGGVAYSWRSSLLSSSPTLTTGSKAILVRTIDVAGNQSPATTASLSVDVTLPTVTLTAPNNNAFVTAATTVTATSSDGGSGVDNVRFEYSEAGKNNWLTIGTDGASPFSVQWNTTGLVIDDYDVRAISYDAAGNARISSKIKVKKR